MTLGSRLNACGLALIAKSCFSTETVTVVTVEWLREPLVPKIVTVYVPGVDELNVQVELAVPPEDRARLLGLQTTPIPVDGDPETERITLPAKPLMLAACIVEDEFCPVLKLIEELLVEREKSGERGMLTVTDPVDWPVMLAESVTVSETEKEPAAL